MVNVEYAIIMKHKIVFLLLLISSLAFGQTGETPAQKKASGFPLNSSSLNTLMDSLTSKIVKYYIFEDKA